MTGDADVTIPHLKERRHSGRSDTTEILMSAPPGGLEREYEVEDRSRRYQPAEDLNGKRYYIYYMHGSV